MIAVLKNLSTPKTRKNIKLDYIVKAFLCKRAGFLVGPSCHCERSKAIARRKFAIATSFLLAMTKNYFSNSFIASPAAICPEIIAGGTPGPGTVSWPVYSKFFTCLLRMAGLKNAVWASVLAKP